LVGNFASEKELYLMLGRFSRELRELPNGLFSGEGASGRIPAEVPPDAGPTVPPEEPFVAPDGEGEPAPERRQEQSEVLSLVRVILEREIGRVGAKGAGREPLEKLLELVRGNDLDELGERYRYLISQVESPTEELERAQKIIAKMFGGR
jgi:hypothetical protein